MKSSTAGGEGDTTPNESSIYFFYLRPAPPVVAFSIAKGRLLPFAGVDDRVLALQEQFARDDELHVRLDTKRRV